MRSMLPEAACTNLTELWWDAEKQAVLTVNGYSGDGADYELFRDFCSCMAKAPDSPQAVRGREQLRALFGYDGAPDPAHCQEIWRLTAQALLERPRTRAEAEAAAANFENATDGGELSGAEPVCSTKKPTSVEKPTNAGKPANAVKSANTGKLTDGGKPAGSDRMSDRKKTPDCGEPQDGGMPTGSSRFLSPTAGKGTEPPAVRVAVCLNRLAARDSGGWQSWAQAAEALLEARLQSPEQTVLLTLPASFRPRKPDLYHVNRILAGQQTDEELWLTQLVCFLCRVCAARGLRPVLQTACSADAVCALLCMAARMTRLPDLVWMPHEPAGLAQCAGIAAVLLRHRAGVREGIPPVLCAVPSAHRNGACPPDASQALPQHLQIRVLSY